MKSTIKVYDLSQKKMIEERVYGGELLKIFYSQWPLNFFIGQRWVQKILSKAVGAYKKNSRSHKQIKPFLEQYEMSLESYQVPEGGFKSFNDFFIRKKKEVSFPRDLSVFPSPCDARLSISRIENSVPALKVKGKDILLPDLFGEHKNQCPKSGWAMTFRLCPLDYHRFHFIDSGVAGETYKLGTLLHSVNPWALQELPHIFEWNERQLTLQQGENYGELLYLEVGAMCVGKIHQTFVSGEKLNRGDEKGYFDFGASTLVLVVGDGVKSFRPDPKILEQNQEGVEVLVQLGEGIGFFN